ncbi:MAG: methyltransferase domain-containing protein [Candidatus Omnitrophica bacterium]|nr:methyltransferase domain-containing protein [Candidatus Omnitrophota bacterium]
MTQIDNTGERILLDKETPLMIARHFCAYRFVKDYVKNLRVLDIGCGEGYGTYFLADFAKEAVGVDYDSKIIEYAKNKYKKVNLSFYEFNAANLGNFVKDFDLFTCFQVIEHIPEEKEFLKNIAEAMPENGIFICSTPNKLDASPHSEKPLNKFHLKEYYFHEFKALLSGYFKTVDVFGLKRGWWLNFFRRLKKIGLFNFLPGQLNPVVKFYKKIDSSCFNIAQQDIDSALDFIAVCKDKKE